MKRICIFAALAMVGLTRVVSAQSTNWPPAGYVEVRAYLYNMEGEGAPPILKEGRLHETVWNPKGARLSEAQIATVQKAVAEYHPAIPMGPANCYTPRHAFVYYDAQGKAVGYVEICFSCWGYRASPRIGERVPIDFDTLKKVFQELKIPVYKNDDAYRTLKKPRAKSP